MKKMNLGSLTLMVLAALMLFKGWIVFGIVLGAIGVSKYTKYLNDPNREVIDKIKSDSNLYGVVVPQNREIQDKLMVLYRRSTVASRTSPQLATEIHALLETFWNNVAAAEGDGDWLRSLSRIERNWPAIEAHSELDLGSRLEDLQRTAKYLNEARQYDTNGTAL